jgi:hypothetical protein
MVSSLKCQDDFEASRIAELICKKIRGGLEGSRNGVPRAEFGPKLHWFWCKSRGKRAAQGAGKSLSPYV